MIQIWDGFHTMMILHIDLVAMKIEAFVAAVDSCAFTQTGSSQTTKAVSVGFFVTFPTDFNWLGSDLSWLLDLYWGNNSKWIDMLLILHGI